VGRGAGGRGLGSGMELARGVTGEEQVAEHKSAVFWVLKRATCSSQRLDLPRFHSSPLPCCHPRLHAQTAPMYAHPSRPPLQAQNTHPSAHPSSHPCTPFLHLAHMPTLGQAVAEEAAPEGAEGRNARARCHAHNAWRPCGLLGAAGGIGSWCASVFVCVCVLGGGRCMYACVGCCIDKAVSGKVGKGSKW